VGAAHRSDEVEQLREAFAEMLGAVDRSTVAQRQLVADASHELRTPLTSMRTNLDLLAEPPGLADPKAPELVEQARAQAKELAGLVADLVQLARDGRAELLVEETRLDLLVEAVVERRIRYRPEVRVDLDLRPCVVLIDVDAAQRAVANLLDNAVKWSPPGAAISVEVGDGAVTVTDCGPGIPETDLPHVFERFYRSAEARSRPGSGLGLAIVAQVAAIHGGSVQVTSSPAGSRFCLSFSVHCSLREPLPQDTPTRTALGGARAARAGDGPD
jgi:two-component system sensor histidine kinase MprB